MLPAGLCKGRRLPCKPFVFLHPCERVQCASYREVPAARGRVQEILKLQASLRALIRNQGIKSCWCEVEKQILILWTNMKGGVKAVTEPLLWCSNVLLHANRSYALNCLHSKFLSTRKGDITRRKWSLYFKGWSHNSQLSDYNVMGPILCVYFHIWVFFNCTASLVQKC